MSSKARQIIELWDEGRGIEEIAARVKTTVTYVREIAYGIKAAPVRAERVIPIKSARREPSASSAAWNDDRVELLKKLWSEGLSASQIASRLGGISRSAVIGKVHRLGLPLRVVSPLRRLSGHVLRKRPDNSKNTRKGSPTRFAAGPKPKSAVVFAVEPLPKSTDEVVVPAEKVCRSIVELADMRCRWPIGDPQHSDFTFCHHEKTAGLPYCQTHVMRAYQPPTEKRRRPFVPGVRAKEVADA